MKIQYLIIECYSKLKDYVTSYNFFYYFFTSISIGLSWISSVKIPQKLRYLGNENFS